MNKKSKKQENEKGMIAEVDHENKIISANSKHIRKDLEMCVIYSTILGFITFMIPIHIMNLFKYGERITRTVFSSIEYIIVLILMIFIFYSSFKGIKRIVGKYKE